LKLTFWDLLTAQLTNGQLSIGLALFLAALGKLDIQIQSALTPREKRSQISVMFTYEVLSSWWRQSVIEFRCPAARPKQVV